MNVRRRTNLSERERARPGSPYYSTATMAPSGDARPTCGRGARGSVSRRRNVKRERALFIASSATRFDGCAQTTLPLDRSLRRGPHDPDVVREPQSNYTGRGGFVGKLGQSRTGKTDGCFDQSRSLCGFQCNAHPLAVLTFAGVIIKDASSGREGARRDVQYGNPPRVMSDAILAFPTSNAPDGFIRAY